MVDDRDAHARPSAIAHAFTRIAGGRGRGQRSAHVRASRRVAANGLCARGARAHGAAFRRDCARRRHVGGSRVSAAAQAAPLWREVLERVLASVAHHGPLNARNRVARAVERALISMQRLEETSLLDPRHLAMLDEALGEIERAAEAAGRLNDRGEASRRLGQVSTAMRRGRSETLEEVVRAQASAPRAASTPPRAEVGMRASIGVPRVHTLVRAFVKPTPEGEDIDLDEAWRALEREAVEAEQGEPIDDTLVVPGGAEQPSSWDRAAFGLRRLARDALEDMGVMSLLRRA